MDKHRQAAVRMLYTVAIVYTLLAGLIFNFKPEMDSLGWGFYIAGFLVGVFAWTEKWRDDE